MFRVTEHTIRNNPKNLNLGADNSILYSDLIGFTRKTTKTDSTKFTAANIKALLNLYYHEFVNEILKSGSNIDFNRATETINLVAAAQAHSVTGKVLRITRIEIQWESGGTWYPVKIFDIGESPTAKDTTTIAGEFSTSFPYADLYLDDEVLKIDIFPIPASSNAGGLKVWKTLEITELSASGSEPSIAEAYQKYLCYGASKEYFLGKEMHKKVAEMEKNMFMVISKAIQFYASRNEEENIQLESGMPDDYGD